MADALFVQSGPGAFTPTVHSRGPWDPSLLHGGPVGALLAHELIASVANGEWFPGRLTVDLVRPVPLTELEITTNALREGRKARLLGAECRSAGTLVARASLQLIARVDLPIPLDSPAKRWATHALESLPDATPQMSPVSDVGPIAFHSTSVEHRSSDHALSGSGPATDWIRVRADLLPGVAPSPFERVVCAADFSNGISSSLPFDEYTFVNADLTVNLFRLPVDEWVLLDAATHIGDAGVGLAESRLFDQLGLLGRACQSLVVARR